MPYLLALNCGSSSIKGKLFVLPASRAEPLHTAAEVGVSNIGSKGDKVKIKLAWTEEGKEGVEEEGVDGGEVKYEDMFAPILDKLTDGGVDKADVKYVTHRIVHGGTHKRGLRITREHAEGLQEMDKLSEFAPLHNHAAVLGVKACLKHLPDHTSLLLFDTLFHQTIPEEVYTYALPPPDQETAMPLRKYGFHGLSYASIVDSLARHKQKRPEDINIVVAHLGSGASSACIKGGKSIDTSMGLTPLEGLIGGTRTGSIDPTAIFHHTRDCSADAGIKDMKVTRAEMVMNKKSGLLGLTGTTNFATISARAADTSASSCSAAEHRAAKLAYDVYLDRLMAYLSQYLCKLLASTPLDAVDGIVFSGGIGEKAAGLRADALGRLAWLGVKVGNANAKADQPVTEITEEDSRINAYVVETDEEGWCAKLARDEFGF
ncbi:hypothetical protein Q5752_004712 [Cryptotrichosporon argae]